jgi:hypothetical protein
MTGASKLGHIFTVELHLLEAIRVTCRGIIFHASIHLISYNNRLTELTTHPSLQLPMSDPAPDHVHPRSFLGTHPFPGTRRNTLHKQV